MGRSLEVAESVRSLAPELAGALSSVHLASRKREREALFSFRYSVYIDELGRGVGTVDHRRRRLHDPEDDEPNTLLLFTGDGRGEISGTARLRHWAPGEVPEDVRARYSLDRFEGIAGLTVAEVGRGMLAPRCRGRLGLRALFGGVCALAVSKLDVDVVFLTCLSGLVDRYRRIGFRSYAASLVPTVDGLTVPLVLILSDRPHLERVGSFLLPLTDAYYGTGKRPGIDFGDWSSLFDSAAGPLHDDPGIVWERVRGCSEHADPGAAFLRALGPATLHKLVEHGFLMNVSAGQVLTKRGLVQQELFVIINGQFEVHDGARRLLGPGEVVGEIGFFGTARRRTASVTAVSDGEVLVLRRRWLDELRESDPVAAADVLFELARVLADRSSVAAR